MLIVEDGPQPANRTRGVEKIDSNDVEIHTL